MNRFSISSHARQCMFFAALAIVSLFSVTSCKDDDGGPAGSDFESGIFIANEGPFQNGTGTITFWNRNTKEVSQQVFETANAGAQLGNIVQSISELDGKFYIVVNNGNKVVVVDAKDFTKTGEITGLALPRFFLGLTAEKALISQWGADGLTGSVAVVNLKTNLVEKTIPTGSGAEGMLKSGNKVYVTNAGGFGRDSTVAVIDITTEAVSEKITVGDNPHTIRQDKNGALWVITRGHTENFNDPNDPLNTKGMLVQIVNNNVTRQLTLPNSGSSLVVSKAGDQLFYLGGSFGGSVYSFGITQNDLSTQPLAAGFFYALGYDSVSGNLLASDAKDFSSNGEVKVFDQTGQEVMTIPAGVTPGGFLGK